MIEIGIGTGIDLGRPIGAMTVHGNEYHDPDFLAVDGSNSPTNNIDWGNKDLTNVNNLEVNGTLDVPLIDGGNLV